MADGRHIVVIRHRAGSNRMFVYASDLQTANTYDLAMTTAGLIRTRATEFEGVLSFGAVRFAADGGHDYFAKGWVHWCKIWYADLGADVAQKLASWIHEPVRMEFAGVDRYRLAGTTSVKANTSWIANNSLTRLRQMNPSATNVGGWHQSKMREFFNGRVLDGLDYGWRSMIKTVKTFSSAGNKSTEIVTSEDTLYLLSNREAGDSTTSVPYVNEGDPINFFVDNLSRIKFPGFIREEDRQVITSDTDPTQLTGYTISEGDIWINTAVSNSGYMYISPETLAKHTTIGCRKVAADDNIQANDGGLWYRAWVWWLRSARADSSAVFSFVNYGGYASYSFSATLSYGLALGFSI